MGVGKRLKRVVDLVSNTREGDVTCKLEAAREIPRGCASDHQATNWVASSKSEGNQGDEEVGLRGAEVAGVGKLRPECQ